MRHGPRQGWRARPAGRESYYYHHRNHLEDAGGFDPAAPKQLNKEN